MSPIPYILWDFFFLPFPNFFPLFGLYCVRRYYLRFFIVSEFHLNPRGFPLHLVLLYFISVAFSECIRYVSRCARELLLHMYIVVSSAKTEVFSSFSPITILWRHCFVLYFPKQFPQSSLHWESLRKVSVYLDLDLYFYVLINCFCFLYYFVSISEML